MSKLKSFEEFVNENLVAKGEYNFYGPGSLKPLVQKLVSEGKNESIIRTYLTSIGVVPWRIDKVMMEMAATITIEKKVNEAKISLYQWAEDTSDEWGDEKTTIKLGKKAGFKEKDLKHMLDDIQQMSDQYIEWAKDIMSESINEGKKMKPFKKVKVGDKATDYNGDVWNVLAVGKVKDLMKYDDSGAAEELDPNEDAIALDGRGGTAVFSYDPDGAAVYESFSKAAGNFLLELNKATFEDAAAAFLLDLPGSDAIDETFDVKKNRNTLFNYIWEFEVKSKVDSKVHKALTKAGIEFGTVHGKLIVQGDTDDEKIRAMEILKSIGIDESEIIAETFDVKKKLPKYLNIWEFEVKSKVDSDVHKALTKAGVEFGTAHGKLIVQGDTNDERIRAIEILKSFGIDESEIIAEKLNKKTLQVEEGDGEDIDDMIDDLADGDDDETQGPDDSAPDGEGSPESKIKDGESPSDAVDGAVDDATSKIKDAAEELAKDSKKLAQLKKILLDESSTNEELTRMVNDGAMSELHLLAKESKDEKDFLKKAKDWAKDMDINFDGGLEKMFKEFYSDMKNESVEEPQEESTSNAYMDAVTEGLKYRFNK